MQYAIYPSIKNKTVVITGGASGIGSALVKGFAEQGAKVNFLDVNASEGKSLENELKAKNYDVHFEHCDLLSIPALQAVLDSIEKKSGAVDVLVNNAGSDERHKTFEVDERLWDKLIGINLKHYFFASQRVLPGMMRKKEGAIINLSSNCFLLNEATDYPLYLISKTAITGLTRTLAKEFGGYGVRVNSILPGWVMTDKQIKMWLTTEAEEDLLRTQSLKQKIYPEDIARLALFLASDDSKMCSRQNYIMDGGRV